MTFHKRPADQQLTPPDVYPLAMLGSSPEYSDSPDACPALRGHRPVARPSHINLTSELAWSPGHSPLPVSSVQHEVRRILRRPRLSPPGLRRRPGSGVGPMRWYWLE